MLQDVRITPDAVNNTLLIYADQANYRIIEATLLQIDQPQLQVAIDATIAEVTLNNDLSYGVQTYLTSQNVGLKPNHGFRPQHPGDNRASDRRRSRNRRRIRRGIGLQRLHQSRISRLQFPDRIGNAAES